MDAYQKRGYLPENYRLFHLTDYGAQVELHYHEFCKLLLLVSGSGSYMVDGKRYLLQAGDAVCVGSRVVHRPELSSETVCERVIIYISPEFLRAESDGECDLLSCFSGSAGHVFRLRSGRWERLLAKVAELEHELSEDRHGKQIAGKALLLQLLVQLSRSMEKPDTLFPDPIRPNDPRIAEILRYLDAHFSEDLYIDRLAEEFYISKYHMMRKFRLETGMTVHAYLSRCRLLEAQNLIRQGMHATQACYRCGFRSYSSFTRAYAKQFGATPTGRSELTAAVSPSYE